MPSEDCSPVGATVTLDELEHDPHRVLARLREREPVSWLPVLDGWLVTRHDLALEVMRDAATFTVDDPRFSTARVVGPSMLSLDGTEHARHRGPFVAPFRPGAVRERFADVTAREAGALIDSLAGANRDPAVFEDPDRFDLSRANARQHLAFAQGPHVCVGIHLARLETRTAIAALLSGLPALRLDPERPSAVRGLVFRKPPSLHVLWSLRDDAQR